GANIKTLGDDARAGWASSLTGFPAQQAADADGRDMPGTEVMNAYLKAVETVGYSWPVTYEIK
ncbi:MAG: C4-dicarboxylate TRAP transporter substrate-binding protein, partial [Geminicoccaceae bacterium]